MAAQLQLVQGASGALGEGQFLLAPETMKGGHKGIFTPLPLYRQERIVKRGQFKEERRILVTADQTGLKDFGRRLPGYILAGEDNLAAVGRQGGRDQAEQGRFAAAIG